MGVVAGRCDDVAVMYAGRIVEQGPVREIFHRTRMPYTAALLSSIPRISDPAHRRLDAIGGRPPDLIDPPPGCAFAPRCKHVSDRCHRVRPEPVTEAGHMYACHYPLGMKEPA